MPNNYLFSSESVSEGHPDKAADQVSDAILDAHIAGDKNSRVACETLLAKDLIVIAGEITSKVSVDYEKIAKDVLSGIGYSDDSSGFNLSKCKTIISMSKQSPDIAQGVNKANDEIGAGDQGLMFGYACDETETLFPLPLYLAHKLVLKQSELRKSGNFEWLKPDAKSQVSVRYIVDKPVKIENIVLSTQHSKDIDINEVRKFVEKYIIKEVIPGNLLDNNTSLFINPTGRFVEGGPGADTGLTGRKIIVDTYGGSAPHGGGAFSGKDPSKVDRSAAYAARYLAKNIVAAGIAKKCTVQFSYAIGVVEPLSVYFNFHNTGIIKESIVEKEICNSGLFDFRPRGIIEMLDLLRPIYRKTAAYGHFGRELPEFTWEKTDKAIELKKLFNL